MLSTALGAARLVRDIPLIIRPAGSYLVCFSQLRSNVSRTYATTAVASTSQGHVTSASIAVSPSLGELSSSAEGSFYLEYAHIPKVTSPKSLPLQTTSLYPPLDPDMLEACCPIVRPSGRA